MQKKLSEEKSTPPRFRVNAEIKDIIGQDLINSDNIAVTELVKNAYDANASLCIINFFEENSPDLKKSRLVIHDDGAGMDKDDITNKWLNIAYSEKKATAKNRRRKMAGNKGVGRFSCDRLGEKLTLYSRKKNSPVYVCLEINWKTFEGRQRDTQITDIPVQLSEIPHGEFFAETKIDDFEHGTYLEIYPLRTSWKQDDLLALRRALERFINPNQEAEANTFKISLQIPTYQQQDSDTIDARKKINGEIKNVVFRELGFRTSYIESAIDSLGENITTSLFHRGKKIFTLTEKNNFARLKDIRLIIYFLNQYNKAYFNRETGIPSVDYGSIFLFLNGFRVPPLGERGDDWLGLDNRKAQGTKRYLGTRDIMGRIEITDNDTSWRIISSREGVVHTDAYYELTSPKHESASYFYAILRKLERYIVDGLQWDSVNENWSAIYDKVMKTRTGKIEESYKLKEIEKENFVLQCLQDIIRQGTKVDDIISLEIDSSVISMLAAQEEERTAEFLHEFKDMANKVEANAKAGEARSLNDFLKKAEQTLKQLHRERDAAIKQAAQYKDQRDEAQEEQANTKAENEIIRRENFFLKAHRNRDIDDVINLHHQIKTWARIISTNTEKLLLKMKRESSLTESDIKAPLGLISVQTKKILKIAELATNANFKVKTVAITYDIVAFLKDYISEISSAKIFRDIALKFAETDTKLVCRFVPIEMTIMIDTFIDNSKKAGASNFALSVIHHASDGTVELLFDDDGKGLDPSITDINTIFDRGITTTDGSGIGLNHAQKIAKEIGGELSVAHSALGGFALTLRLHNAA